MFERFPASCRFLPSQHSHLLKTHLRWVTSLALLLCSGQLTAQETNCNEQYVPALGDYDFLKTEQALPDSFSKVGKVHITRLPIFNEADPRENNWLYRFANDFHILTKKENIDQQLLFKEGDEYDPRVIEESARLLRKLNHLYDAGIQTVKTCENKVDLEVVTRDVWSLNLDLSFGREGGENTYRVGISDSNFLGTGKDVSLINKKDSDRNSVVFGYKDNNVLGTRIRSHIVIADSDDGSHELFRLYLPFYAIDTRQAWGINLENNERIDTQYLLGDEVSEIKHEIEDYSIFYGFSDGLKGGISNRWSLGYRYREDIFTESEFLPPPTTAPRNQTLSYPFVQFETIEDNYTTSFNLDQIHRTEDLHLGYSFRTSFGYASSELGSDFDRYILDGNFSDTLLYTDKILLQHSLSWYGVWNQDNNESEDVLLSYDLKYFRSQTELRSFFTQFSAVWSDNLNSNQQILLGGSTGLRGYDKRFQSGDRRFVLTIEERQYTNYHLLNLAYLGFAAFIDIGRAWQPGIDSGLDDKILADVGFGIRLASSKADAGRIIHIDFAFPITNRDAPGVDNMQVVIKIKNSL